MPKLPRWTVKMIPWLLAGLPAMGAAAELPPLRVDPALLGDAPKADRPPTGGAASTPPAPRRTPASETPRERAAVPSRRDAPATPPPEPGVTTVDADRIGGQQDVELSAEGNVVLRRDGATLYADRVVYREALDEVEAEGNVVLERGGDRIAGPRARVRLDEQSGEIVEPAYSFERVMAEGPMSHTVTGHGEATVIALEGENQYRLEGATWSTCEPPDPDWYLRAGELELDYDRNLGEARHGTVVFKDVPIFYMPWIEFPLVSQRKSGFLPPTFGTSNKTGVDLTVPYYWNIAPNYDATFAPRYMSRRGLQLGGEYRYLTERTEGALRAEVLPNDGVTGQSNRAAGSIRHNQSFGGGWSTAIDLNGVSDDEYFEDLSSRLALASQTNLLRQARLSYSPGSWWSASALVQAYQTLSGSKPYRRLPQLKLNGNRLVWGHGEFDLKSEFVQFAHKDDDRAEGSRATLYPSLEWPLGGTALTVTPKLGLHYTRYTLDEPLTADGRESITRTLPIFTLDSRVVFERDTQWGGRDTIQTLEPRLFYVNIPYRRQDDIPNFDSGLYDFNFAQIFAENIFSGGDRIANANQITAAVTSRFIDTDSGAERIRAALGQRYYFADQRVTLPGVPARTGRRADILASVGGSLSRTVLLDSGWQYNPRDKITERFHLDLRYQPGFARVLNAGFRYSRDVLRDFDLSGQWPLGGRWYGVARYNRSLRDHRVTEALAGLEYDGGCWVFRSAFHRFATTEEDVTQAIFLQLELNDLASVGSSPVDLLRRTVGGYGTINQPVADPFFGQ